MAWEMSTPRPVVALEQGRWGGARGKKSEETVGTEIRASATGAEPDCSSMDP